MQLADKIKNLSGRIFNLRFFNVVFSLSVLGVNLVRSYNHSVSLFNLGGDIGWMAHLGVIGIEILFLQGAINIIVSRFRGVFPGWPAIFGALLGVLLVGLSNTMAGWEHGWIGITLGVAVPLAMIVSEAILAKEFIQALEANTPPIPNGIPHTNHQELQEEQEKQAFMEKLEKLQKENPPETIKENSPPKTPPRVSKAKKKSSPKSPPISPNVLQWIEEYHLEHGESPSRKVVVESLGVSEWSARKALGEFKKLAS